MMNEEVQCAVRVALPGSSPLSAKVGHEHADGAGSRASAHKATLPLRDSTGLTPDFPSHPSGLFMMDASIREIRPTVNASQGRRRASVCSAWVRGCCG